MKKTLLALMLVSSLFVISCGADATKPEDLQAKSYESKTGTATAPQISATTDTAIDAATYIYTGLNPTIADSVKITKIVSMKLLDTTTQQYTTDVTFKENKNAAGDIVVSVTPTTANLNGNMVSIVYQYKIDTLPLDSTGAAVNVNAVKPTLEAEVTYNTTTHNAGIKIDNAALSLGKKYMYKLYTGTSTEPAATEPADIATEGSITLTSTELTGLADGDKVYYKIWVY